MIASETPFGGKLYRPGIPLANTKQLVYIVYMLIKNENDAGSGQNEKNAPQSDLSGLRILLVDDVETNRMIFKILLAKTGIVVDEADSGKAALDMFAGSPEGYYDAVFMDIQMPEMDGFETTRCLREMPRQDARKTPVVAMTADAYEDMEESGRTEMNGYLAKPVDINEMKNLLNELLRNC